MDRLPTEVLIDIFRRLDYWDLKRLCRVCRRFNYIISDHCYNPLSKVNFRGAKRLPKVQIPLKLRDKEQVQSWLTHYYYETRGFTRLDPKDKSPKLRECIRIHPALEFLAVDAKNPGRICMADVGIFNPKTLKLTPLSDAKIGLEAAFNPSLGSIGIESGPGVRQWGASHRFSLCKGGGDEGLTISDLAAAMVGYLNWNTEQGGVLHSHYCKLYRLDGRHIALFFEGIFGLSFRPECESCEGKHRHTGEGLAWTLYGFPKDYLSAGINGAVVDEAKSPHNMCRIGNMESDTKDVEPAGGCRAARPTS